MQKRKTVLLPLLFGLTLRNYLRTDFLEELSNHGFSLVCLIPDLNLTDVLEEFEPLGVQFYTYPRYEPTWIEKRLRDICDVQFYKTHPLFCLKHKSQQISEKNFKKYFVNYKLIQPLLKKGSARALLHHYRAQHRTESIDLLWEEIKPDILLSTNSFFWEELPLIAKAKQTKIPVYGAIHSWDNLTTKYRLPYEFDKVGVWNQIMFDEFKKFYPDHHSNCDIVGVPQFDYYFKMDQYGKTKEQFLKDVGLDPNLPLISYTTVPDRISPSCYFDVRCLLEAIKDGYFSTPVNVLVRFHQTGNIKDFDQLKDYPNCHIEMPGRMSKLFKDNYNPTWEDMIHFADTLRHSDCTINVRSTLTIDASFFDVPIVNVAGDFSQEKKADQHIRDLYCWEHYVPIVDSGAVDLAQNKEEYLLKIKDNLVNRSHRQEGRERLKKMFSGPQPGCSAQVLAQSVLSLVR